jgi:hypothetical protein
MSWAAVATGVGGLIGGMSSKGGGGQTTAASAPWGPSQDFLQRNLGHAEYRVLNPSPYLTQGVDSQAQRAMQGNPLNQAAQGNAMQTLQGDFLSPNSNPYLRDTVNQAMGDARAQINGQFAGDNYGSSAHQEWLTKGLMNQALPMYNQNYQQERQRQMGAQALAPTLANQDYTDINQLQNAGNASWDQLMKAQQIYQGTGGMGGTQSQPYFQNQAAGIMGGALGGMSLYNGLNQGGLLGGTGYTGGNMGGPTGAWGMTGGTF